MKSLFIAVLMTASAAASAVTTEYGPGAYKKTVKVCGYAKSGSAQNCKMMTYKWYAPRAERVCNKEGRGEKLTCFNRISTGNYGYRKFKNLKEAREILQRENSEGRSGRN